MPPDLKVKKSSKTKSVSAVQLEALRQTQQPSSKEANKPLDSIRHDVRNLGKDVLTDMVIELAEPFNPLLSWFGESNQSLRGRVITTSVQSIAAPNTTNTQTNVKPQPKALCNLPLKSPPCKRCPAISGGTCKCAVKVLNG